jgi:hypothetical protein
MKKLTGDMKVQKSSYEEVEYKGSNPSYGTSNPKRPPIGDYSHLKRVEVSSQE